MPLLNLNRIEYANTTVWINASIRNNRSKCPNCGKYSKKIHDRYIRTITDLPVFQYRTIILLKTRKFKCGNSHCKRKVFSEQIPVILRYSRRTKRVSKILEALAIESPRAHWLRRALPTSRDRFPVACRGVSEHKKLKILFGDRRFLAAGCEDLQLLREENGI
jgi:transposase